MTTPFPFVSGAVLTAAQMNDITNLPINDQTASYTLVVGDAGKRVIMNVASANTVTVNDSVFTTGDTIFIANKGAGVSTVTAGSGVTINTADSLALVQHQSGVLVAQSASVFAFYPSNKAINAGLVFVTSGTFSASSAVNVDNCFTSTYENYRVIFEITASATATGDTAVGMRVGGATNTTSNYSRALRGLTTAGSGGDNSGSSNTSWSLSSTASNEDNGGLIMDFIRPQLTTKTAVNAFWYEGVDGAFQMGVFFFGASTAFDGFTVTRSSGTMTGNYRVYGYANS
jgi:hypothetical protein